MPKRQRQKYTLVSAKEVFKEKGLTLLAEIYTNKDTKMPFRCDECGYEDGIRLGDVKNQKHDTACKKCNRERRAVTERLNIDDVKKEALKNKISIQCDDYKNSSTAISAVCLVCNHSWTTNANRLKTGSGCRPCGVKRRVQKRTLNKGQVEERLGKYNITLKSKYSSNHTPIEVLYKKCQCTDSKRSLQEIQSAKGRCPNCSPYSKVSKQKYEAFAKKKRGQIVYIPQGAQDEATWICPVGHTFKRSWTNIHSTGTFCTTCTSAHSEQLCRAVIEALFKAPFSRVRLKGMKSVKGLPLELDCYNKKLKIALEHNGGHHYEPQENWGGEKAFKIQKKNDQLRRAYCKKNGIILIEIRELGKYTTIEGVREEIRRSMREAGRKLPENFDNVDLLNLKIITQSEDYLTRVKDKAKEFKITVHGTFLRADDPMDMECLKCGWRKLKTPRSLLQGHGCPDCKLKKMRKPVTIRKVGASKLQVFQSGTAAAIKIGVTKEAVNRAARLGRPVKGYFVLRETTP